MAEQLGYQDILNGIRDRLNNPLLDSKLRNAIKFVLARGGTQYLKTQVDFEVNQGWEFTEYDPGHNLDTLEARCEQILSQPDVDDSHRYAAHLIGNFDCICNGDCDAADLRGAYNWKEAWVITASNMWKARILHGIYPGRRWDYFPQGVYQECPTCRHLDLIPYCAHDQSVLDEVDIPIDWNMLFFTQSMGLLTVEQLRSYFTERGMPIPVRGKSELIFRIHEFIMNGFDPEISWPLW